MVESQIIKMLFESLTIYVIAIFPCQKFVVTVGDKGITIINLLSGEIFQTIEMSKMCRDVTINDKNLIIATFDGTLEIISRMYW